MHCTAFHAPIAEDRPACVSRCVQQTVGQAYLDVDKGLIRTGQPCLRDERSKTLKNNLEHLHRSDDIFVMRRTEQLLQQREERDANIEAEYVRL
jgi:hypothetical protein